MKKRRLFAILLLAIAIPACSFWLAGGVAAPSALGLRVVARTNDMSDVPVIAFEVTNRSLQNLQLFCKSSLGESSGPHLLPGRAAQMFTLKDEALSGQVNGRVFVDFTPVPGALRTKADGFLRLVRAPFHLIRWTRVEAPGQVAPNHSTQRDRAIPCYVMSMS